MSVLLQEHKQYSSGCLCYSLTVRDGEEWLKQRIPISKFIMMPRKMAEYHGPFNQVTQDYIDYLRSHRTGGVFKDIADSLNRWSLECESVFLVAALG
jgi:hypothetical protein